MIDHRNNSSLLYSWAAMKLIKNLISYSIVRDEYREYVKAKRN